MARVADLLDGGRRVLHADGIDETPAVRIRGHIAEAKPWHVDIVMPIAIPIFTPCQVRGVRADQRDHEAERPPALLAGKIEDMAFGLEYHLIIEIQIRGT